MLSPDSGILTAYVHRLTEDPHEKMATIRTEVNFFLEGVEDSVDCGFGELANLLGA